MSLISLSNRLKFRRENRYNSYRYNRKKTNWFDVETKKDLKKTFLKENYEKV